MTISPVRLTTRIRRSRAPLALATVALLTSACASASGRSAASGSGERAGLRQLIDSLVSAPKFRSAQLGILIVDPARGDTLYSRNAGKLFIPASNQKLLTGSVALHLLGPDFRWGTALVARGRVDGDVLDGDLEVHGRGDPSVSDRMRGDAMLPLLEVADSLRARGIRRITGHVLPGADAFPDASAGFGWAWDDFDFAYSARIDELTMNEGFTRVVVHAGDSVGAAPRVRVTPVPVWPVVEVRATTVARDPARPRTTSLRLARDAAGTGLVVHGQVALGDSAALTITYADPSEAYVEALAWALVSRGIAVDQRPGPFAVGDGNGGAARTGDTLFVMRSPPLSRVLAAFEKPSQNQIGELLLKTLGLERAGVGSADSGAAVVRRQLLAWGALPDGFIVRDGSGLSRHNVVTPETIVKVLDAMRTSPHFRTFHDALPIAGVDGTIAGRMKGTPAERNVHAKTGTLDLARSLSGYVTTADGRLLLFSMLANNWTTPVREVEMVQDTILARVAGARLGGR